MQHTTPRRYSEEDWRAAMRLYGSGASAAVVSAKFGMSKTAIYHRASALGLTKRDGRVLTAGQKILKRVQRPPETYEAAAKAYIEEGVTARVAAQRFGLNRSTLTGYFTRNGITKRDAAQARHAPPVSAAARDEKTRAQIAHATRAWENAAHAAQRAPAGVWSTWLFQGGRGAGKTRAGAEWIAAFAAAHGTARIALVGAAMRDVREVMVDGPSGLASLEHWPQPRYEAGRNRLVFPSGAIAYAFSSQEPERLRGPQFDAAWADEFCAWRRADYTLRMLRMGLRRGASPRLVVTTTPKPIAALRAACGVVVRGHAGADGGERRASGAGVRGGSHRALWRHAFRRAGA